MGQRHFKQGLKRLPEAVGFVLLLEGQGQDFDSQRFNVLSRETA